MTGRSARVDDKGRAYAGSQLQIQIYVNRRHEELSLNVINALPSLVSLNPRLRWASPLQEDNFIEYQDKTFLSAAGMDHFAGSLREFWPRGGPTWDALAVAEITRPANPKGVVLVEAKSHPDEIYGSGCRASPESRKRIEAALDQTKRWLGVSENANWTGPLYQSANRLAHLYFFREIMKIPAWLVNIYFLNDPHSPTSREKWNQALSQVMAEIGLRGIVVPHAGEVFLEAKDRTELFEM